MTGLCVSIVRNKWRPRFVRVIAGLMLIPISAFAFEPIMMLLHFL